MKQLIMAVTLCTGMTVVAQPRVQVEQEVVNVGEVLFQQPKEVKFTLRNVGSAPLTVREVNASCGCTTTSWTRTPIAAGESGTVTAIYDARMLGTFQKELEVWTSDSEVPLYLTLQGRVVTAVSEYDGDFPVDLGAVRLSSNEVEFDDVNRGDRPVAQLEVVNTSRGSYTPRLMHLPPYLTARYLPERLAGGRQGRILLTLDSRKLSTFGLTQTSIYLARHLGDKVSPENEITVSAVLLPDFSKLTESQLQKAPHMSLSADSVVMEPLGSKKHVTQTLVVTNTGRSPLQVNRLQVYGKALGVSLSNRTIKPRKTAKLKVTVYAKYLKDNSRPRVLLITNDPSRPKTVIPVKAEK